MPSFDLQVPTFPSSASTWSKQQRVGSWKRSKNSFKAAGLEQVSTCFNLYFNKGKATKRMHMVCVQKNHLFSNFWQFNCFCCYCVCLLIVACYGLVEKQPVQSHRFQSQLLCLRVEALSRQSQCQRIVIFWLITYLWMYIWSHMITLSIFIGCGWIGASMIPTWFPALFSRLFLAQCHVGWTLAFASLLASFFVGWLIENSTRTRAWPANCEASKVSKTNF